MSAVGQVFREWWNRPSRFDSITQYLEWHNLRFPAQMLFASCAVILGVVPLVMLNSPDGAGGTTGAAVVIVAFVGALLLAACWLWRWPTEPQSIAFVVASDFGIGLTSIIDRHPLAGLGATQAFVLLGFYVALFHTARVMVLHIGWTVAVCSSIAAILAFGEYADPVAGVAKLLLSLVVLVTVPVGVQVFLPLLRADAAAAAQDPLTGLFNRRGLAMAVHARFSRGGHPGRFAVFVIDIDNFKSINDTFGHAAGDQVLRGVGRALREAVVDGDVARVGGEEFVIVSVAPPEAVQSTAEALREKATQTVGVRRVTVSVGSSRQVTVESAADAVALLPGLIREADKAMYRAKSSGGDRVVLTQV